MLKHLPKRRVTTRELTNTCYNENKKEVQQVKLARKNLCCLPTAFCLAQKMGKLLGGGEVL